MMKGTALCAAAVVVALASVTNGQDPAPADQKLFEPTYRAAKTLQGATTTGVTYARYSELLQAMATELAIVRDQRPSGDQEIKLMALFESTLRHYEAAGVFWKALLNPPTERTVRPFKGIPIYFEKRKNDDAALKLAKEYDLPIATANAGGALAMKVVYSWVPTDSPQRVWSHADDALEKATAMFYGR